MVERVSSPRVLNRDDVVLYDGQLTLLNSTLTPREAMIEDLLFLRAVLVDAEIRFLLVRGDHDELVLVVDREDRRALRLALAAACQNEPFYSKPARLSQMGKPVKSARDSAGRWLDDRRLEGSGVRALPPPRRTKGEP